MTAVIHVRHAGAAVHLADQGRAVHGRRSPRSCRRSSSSTLKAWVEGRRTRSEARTVLQKIVDAGPGPADPEAAEGRRPAQDRPRGRVDAAEAGRLPLDRRRAQRAVHCRGRQRPRHRPDGPRRRSTRRCCRSAARSSTCRRPASEQSSDNAECSAIVQVLGAGSGRTFDLARCATAGILIMADADVDGSHIRTLLITLFAKYMRPVIEAGRLYAAMPPLHKITTKGRNPETIFTYTQAEMEHDGRPAGEGGQAGRHADPAVQGSRRDGRRRAVGHHDEPGHRGPSGGSRSTTSRPPSRSSTADGREGRAPPELAHRLGRRVDQANDRRLSAGREEHRWHARHAVEGRPVRVRPGGRPRHRQPADHRGRGLLPGVRLLGHPLPRAARRARRAQAGPPADPVLDERAGPPARPRRTSSPPASSVT